MNVVSREVHDHAASGRRRSVPTSRCLNSGAVKRSISPADRDDVRVVVDLAVRDLELDRHPRDPIPAASRIYRGRGRVGEPDVQELARRPRGTRSARPRAARSRCRRRAPRRRRSAPRRRPRAAGRRAARASAAPGSSATSTRLARHVRGRARGDQVGDQHGVVEAVEREVGARGEHADDAPQHGADERAGRDRDGGQRLAARRSVGRVTRASRRGRRRNDIAQAAARAGAPARSRASRRARRSAAGRGRDRSCPGSGRARARGRTRSTCERRRRRAGSGSRPGRARRRA